MNEDRKDKKIKKDDLETSNIDFILCPKHGTRYPKGSRCPLCEKEKDN